jgi:acyl CoA:acetate/3-ketoacid CoA transferase
MMRNTGADLRALPASKLVTAAAAVRHIRHGDTLATGGNICISQHTQRLAFVGTFGAGHPQVEVQAAALVTTRDAAVKKHIAA